MAQGDAHRKRYERLRRDAFREENSEEIRVEAFFLAAFHLIDASAARHNVHINKHQNVRKELEANERVFGSKTTEVWKAFQELEVRIRPKFVYGSRWGAKDFERAVRRFEAIEALCREVPE
jgi:hypothetical protein